MENCRLEAAMASKSGHRLGTGEKSTFRKVMASSNFLMGKQKLTST